jgi:hypothetical protein
MTGQVYRKVELGASPKLKVHKDRKKTQRVQRERRVTWQVG